MSKLHLLLVIHSHQPFGNFDQVFERCYAKSYLPFLELLHRHPHVRIALHYSGPLLDWIERRHAEFLELLRVLVERNQVELWGGGFYEPILISITPEDRHEQLQRLNAHLERRLGRRPRGAWLAERVWEPQLPSTLAAAGIEYTLVDEAHFLAAGIEQHAFQGYYVAEELGATLKILPGRKSLRYLIPFHTADENIDYLLQMASNHPGGCIVMGDDCEKFGVWPGTYELCYRKGWLESFFGALAANSDRISMTLPGEYLDSHPPLGRADLPTASYSEMMEWALPTPARERFHGIYHEFSSRPEVQAFLRGASWRGFLSKYAEANLLQKKMLHVSGKVRRMARDARRGLPLGRAVEEASTCVLRAQCNDAYWHGIFGGIYLPHLRAALWRELIHAETLADAAEHGRANYADVSRFDFDGDAREELYFTSDAYAALLDPADGATVAALDFRGPAAALINSMKRRREPYHARLPDEATDDSERVASIHEQTRVKEAGLAERLVYDRWARHAFRLLLFAPWKTFEDYVTLRLEESDLFAGGVYDVVKSGSEMAELSCEGTLGESDSGARLYATKLFSFARSAEGFEIACDLRLSHRHTESIRLQAGVEVVLNLLAPAARDRYIAVGKRRHPLDWASAVSGANLRLVDEWQKVAVTLEAPGAEGYWISPIETVSESEAGFERVYQGSQVLARWPVELPPGTEWKARLVMRVSRLG